MLVFLFCVEWVCENSNICINLLDRKCTLIAFSRKTLATPLPQKRFRKLNPPHRFFSSRFCFSTTSPPPHPPARTIINGFENIGFSFWLISPQTSRPRSFDAPWPCASFCLPNFRHRFFFGALFSPPYIVLTLLDLLPWLYFRAASEGTCVCGRPADFWQLSKTRAVPHPSTKRAHWGLAAKTGARFGWLNRDTGHTTIRVGRPI